jgi:hypothetical protein
MLQAQKAQEAQMPMNIDSTSQPKVATQYNINTDGSKIIEKPMPLKPSNTTKTTNTKPGPTLEKTTVKPKTVVKKKEVKKSSGIKPKAVMKRVN